MIHALNEQVALLVAPQTMSNSATVTANLDCRGAAYATIRVGFASELNTNAVGPTISLLHCDTTVVTNFATITADRSAEDITNAKALVYHVDLKGKKRYLRMSVTTATATNDDVTLCALSSLTRLSEAPSSTTEMVQSTNDAAVVIS